MRREGLKIQKTRKESNIDKKDKTHNNPAHTHIHKMANFVS